MNELRIGVTSLVCVAALAALVTSACSDGPSATGSGATGGSGLGGAGTAGAGGDGGTSTGGGGGAGGAGGAGGGVPGEIDATFGDNGFATAAAQDSQNDDVIYSITRQPDGKTIIAGATSSAYFGEGLLYRVGTDGKLDPSFGIGGKLLISTSSRGIFRAAAVTPSGEIIAVGTAAAGIDLNRVLIAKLDASGALVPSFGDGGLALGAQGSAWAVALDPDGKIVISGALEVPANGPRLLVQRFNADGTADASFGQAGQVDPILAGGIHQRGTSVAIDAAGRIVVSGPSDMQTVAVVRLTPTGALDLSFSGDGLFTAPTFKIGKAELANTAPPPSSMIVKPDGSLFMAGGADGKAAVLAVTAAGDIDATFGGGDGIGTIDASGFFNNSISLQLMADGKVLAGGKMAGTSNGVARLTPDGALDATFDGDGILILPPSIPVLSDMAIGADQNLLCLSRVTNLPNSLPAAHLVRLDPAGAVDPAFGTPGFYSGARGEVATLIRALPDGGFVVGGASYTSAKNVAMIARHSPDGALEPTFGDGGVTLIPELVGVSRMAVQPDGKIVFTGSSPVVNEHLVARLGKDGALDPTFGAGGILHKDDPWVKGVRSVEVDASGRIILAGGLAGSPRFVGIKDDGSLDPTFGSSGEIVADTKMGYIADHVALPDGSIIALGKAGVYTSFVLRVAPDATIDAGFGALVSAFAGNRVAAAPDGGIYMGGYYMPADFSQHHVGIMRFAKTGELDKTFGKDGVVSEFIDGLATVIVGPSVIPLPDGGFFAVEMVLLDREHMIILKYKADGTPDLAFGEGGRLAVAGKGAWAAYDGALQPDGKLVVAGRGFSPVTGTDFGLVRISP